MRAAATSFSFATVLNAIVSNVPAAHLKLLLKIGQLIVTDLCDTAGKFCNVHLSFPGVLGDGKHLVFECPALQDLRDGSENLFQAPQGDSMIFFMWQDDIIGVARFIDACFGRVYTLAGSPVGGQTSDQP